MLPIPAIVWSLLAFIGLATLLFLCRKSNRTLITSASITALSLSGIAFLFWPIADVYYAAFVSPLPGLRAVETIRDIGYALLLVSFTIALLPWLLSWYQSAAQGQWRWFILLGLCIAISWYTLDYLLVDVLEQNSAMMVVRIVSGDLGVIAALVFARRQLNG